MRVYDWDEASYSYHTAGGSNNESSWDYDGCYPNYFNASGDSAPVATFVDGHVDLIKVEDAKQGLRRRRQQRLRRCTGRLQGPVAPWCRR